MQIRSMLRLSAYPGNALPTDCRDHEKSGLNAPGYAFLPVARLTDLISPLPASYAEIPDADIASLPHWGTSPLTTHLHITPTDYGRKNNIPSDFDPRPSSQPGFTPPTPSPATTP